MRLKALCAATLCAVALAALGAGSAFAGEVTGNGKKTLWTATISTPEGDFHLLHGKSICAFSGQNDEFILDGDENAPRTQSWGQEVRNFTPVGGGAGVPGTACNPTKGFEE
jgi:hypothetical protein